MDAIRENNPTNAEKRCGHRAWAEGKFPLQTIFRNTRKGKADLRRIALSQRNRRAFVLLKIVQGTVFKGEFFALVEKRGGGWLIAGVTAKREAADAYINKRPFYPADAEALRDALVMVFSQRRSWRVRKLAVGAFQEGLYARYLEGPLPAAELKVTNNSATFGELVLIKHRLGWRVAGPKK